MHFGHRLLWPLVCTSLLLSQAHAQGLRWGLNGMAKHPPKLNAIGEGRRDFLEYNCYACHGMNGAGGEGPNVQHAPESLVQNRIENGGSLGMRSFKKYLGQKDIANITAYLASIGTKKEPTWVDWWNENPGTK